MWYGNKVYPILVSGEFIRTITNDAYDDLAVHDSQLYATDGHSPSVHVYDCRTWQKLRSINTPCSDSKHVDDLYGHTISVNSKRIRLSCFWQDRIYVLDPHGTLKETHGPRITIIASPNEASEQSYELSELQRPLICQMNDDGEVLLADYLNDRMLIVTAEGHWRQVKLNGELQRPSDAVWWNGTLYVSTWDDDKLTMFQ